MIQNGLFCGQNQWIHHENATPAQATCHTPHEWFGSFGDILIFLNILIFWKFWNLFKNILNFQFLKPAEPLIIPVTSPRRARSDNEGRRQYNKTKEFYWPCQKKKPKMAPKASKLKQAKTYRAVFFFWSTNWFFENISTMMQNQRKHPPKSKETFTQKWGLFSGSKKLN